MAKITAASFQVCVQGAAQIVANVCANPSAKLTNQSIRELYDELIDIAIKKAGENAS